MEKGIFMIRPLTLIVLSVLALHAQAKVDAAQAARLGQDLTPFGAERAANTTGSIPAWTGGILLHQPVTKWECTIWIPMRRMCRCSQ